MEIPGKKILLATEILWSIASNKLNHIFAGSGNGEIYRTTNLGDSWELVYNVHSIDSYWELLLMIQMIFMQTGGLID